MKGMFGGKFCTWYLAKSPHNSMIGKRILIVYMKRQLNGLIIILLKTIAVLFYLVKEEYYIQK